MALPTYSWEEVQKHNTPQSLWLVIDGNVYDVTNFTEEHPGGEEVLEENAGFDATTAFQDIGHSPDAIALREKYLIGVVEGSSPVSSSSSTGSSTSINTLYRLKAAAIVLLPTVAVAVLAVGLGIFIYKKYHK